MHSKPRIIGIGSALVDAIAFVPDEFLETLTGQKGGMELIDFNAMQNIVSRLPEPAILAPGGAAANTIVGLAQLGCSTRMLTKIGPDSDGEYYRNAVAQAGIEVSAFRSHKTQSTGRCLSLVTPDSQRTMRTCLGAAATLCLDDITDDCFTNCTHVHIEGYLLFNRDLLLHLLQKAKSAGCTISLDLAAPEVVAGNLPLLPNILADYVDMVFANEDEAATFARTPNPYTALTHLNEFSSLAAVKLGARGSLLANGNGEVIEVQPKKVKAVDTTGAGDSWAAGFLYGYLTGMSLAEAGRLASHVAAAVVQELGAGLPTETWAAIRDEFGIKR